jgi:cell division protein FtsQ
MKVRSSADKRAVTPLASWWRLIAQRLPRREKNHRRLGQPGFIPVAEAERRRAKMVRALGVALAMATLLGTVWFAGPRFFSGFLASLSYVQISAVRVHGTHVVDVKRIKELAGIVENRSSMLTIDEAAVAERIRTDPWVSDATVRRDWLDMAVDITITENEPVALVNRRGQGGPELWYADARGDGFLPMKVGQDADYPVISGLDCLANEKERHEALAAIMFFLKKAARVTKDARQKNLYLTTPTISEILVTPEKRLVLFLVDYPFPIFLGNNTQKQFAYLGDALGKLYGDMKNIKIEDIVAIEVGYYGDERIRLIRKIGKEEGGGNITGSESANRHMRQLL